MKKYKNIKIYKGRLNIYDLPIPNKKIRCVGCVWFDGKEFYGIEAMYEELKGGAFTEDIEFCKLEKGNIIPLAKLSTLHNPVGYAEEPKGKRVSKKAKSIYAIK